MSRKKDDEDILLELKSSDFIEEQRPIIYYLSTGCTILDLAIANRLPGGIAAGRITHIFGDESTAKTAIGAEILGSAQRQNGVAVLDDVEGTWDCDFAKLFGVNNSERWVRISSETIEDLFDKNIPVVLRVLDKVEGKPFAMLIDTLSALPSQEEKKSGLSDSTYGTSRAKQLSKAFRKTISNLNKTVSPLALVFVDQTRINVGITFGDSKTTSGGKALKFYASTRIKLSFDSKISNSLDKTVGIKLNFKVVKNKVSVPFREGSLRLLFDYGIDDLSTSLEWLHENDPEQLRESPTKKRRPWRFRDIKAQSLDKLVREIENNNLEFDLIQEVERVWKEVHITTERKPKIRETKTRTNT